MQTLKDFKFGWPALNDALAQIVTAINRNSPLEGTGITLTEHGEQGVSINAAAKKSNQKGQDGGGGTGQVPLKMIFAACKWQSVLVVDPATCEQRSITFLESTGSSADTIEWDVTDNGNGSWTLIPPSVT